MFRIRGAAGFLSKPGGKIPFFFAILSIAGLLLGEGWVSPAGADQILLDNGDRVTGKVQSIDGDTLTFTTEYAESFKIKTHRIEKIRTEEPVEVFLSNGWRVKGRLRTGADGRLAILSDEGAVKAFLNPKKVHFVKPPDGKWSGNLSLGGSLQSGNTDRASYVIDFTVKREYRDDRVKFRFLHNYSEEDKEVTSRNTYGNLKFDHFFDPKWYLYLGLEMLRDEFKDLNLRTTIGPGLGYRVWNDPVKTLELEAGISYFSEDRMTGEDQQWATGRGAFNFSYRLTERLLLTDELVIFPSAEDLADYKLRNEVALKTDLGNGWTLKLANILEHDSKPSPGVEKTDLTSTVALGYDF